MYAMYAICMCICNIVYTHVIGVEKSFDPANRAFCILVNCSVVVSNVAGCGRLRESRVKMLPVTSDSLAGGRAVEE
jgi:hypothetical protein